MSERGALFAAAAVVAMMLLFLRSDVAEAKSKNYVVGEDQRNNWAIITSPYYYPPNGSTLKIGDTLQFKYNRAVHNVVGVGEKGYRNCDGSHGSKPYTSGNDKIALKKGWNYFICTMENKATKATKNNLCYDFGMKIAVKAT